MENEGWHSFDTLEYVYEYNELNQVTSLKSKAEIGDYTYHSKGQIDSIYYEDLFHNQYRTEQYDSYGNQIVFKELYPPDPSLTTYRTEYYYKGFPAKVQDEVYQELGTKTRQSGKGQKGTASNLDLRRSHLTKKLTMRTSNS